MNGMFISRKIWKLAVITSISFLLLHYVASSSVNRTSFNYSAVADLGTSCAHRDSCAYKRTTGSRGLDSVIDRNCACDYKCEEYDDCCVDSPNFSSLQITNNPKSWTCFELRQFGGVYMKETCSNTTIPDLIQLCENSNPDDFSDPLGAMPVTDSSTGLTYKNYYCGLCNDNSENLVLWTPRLECPTLTIYNNSRKNLTNDYVFQNLLFDGVNWGVYLDGDNGSLFFHDCVIDPVMPPLLESKIRLCKPISVADCPLDWEDDDVRFKCKAYTGLRYLHDEIYRNVHCAMCNGINVSQLACQPAHFREVIFFRTFERHSFSLLLDINEHNGKYVGHIDKCKKDEVFDPFFRKCRNLICLPGYRRMGSRCVPEDNLQSTSTTTMATGIPVITIDNGTDISIQERNVTYVVDNGINTDDGSYTEPPINTNGSDGITYNTTDLENQNPGEEIGKFKSCLLITLNDGEYIFFDNKTIYIPKYDKLYEPTNYFTLDGSVLVCSHLDPEPKPEVFPVMSYVTVIGLGVSMICLFLHCLIFSVVPDLQNLSGKNLLSQSIALFWAYGSFMMSNNTVHNTYLCTAAAFLTFYFFQASFFWMNIMAYDVWRTLRMATMELRVSNGKQRKRFLCYSLYAWITPFLIVCLGAISEYSDIFPEDYRPGFAQPACWFKRKRALLVFFAAPLFAVIISNIFLFISSAKMIIITTKTTVKQQSSSQKRNFKLYLRLAILMGLTWAVGLVASYADFAFLWYVFVVLNTLQGFFIFIGFSCTSKVFSCIKDRLTRNKSVSEFKSGMHSTSNSGCQHTNSTTALTTVSKYSTKQYPVKKNSVTNLTSDCSKSFSYK